MNRNKKEIVVLYLKDKNMRMMQTTQQTKNIQDATNKKIKDLGNKFYQIKNLFDRMNLKRDDLYILGKRLEEEFKNEKKDIKLQNQKKRMKDSLICWYAEFFYHEILDINSSVFQQLFQLSLNPNFESNESKYKNAKPVKNKKKNETGITKNFLIKKDIEKVQPNIDVDESERISLYDEEEARVNKEIDSFDLSNMMRKNSIQDDEKCTNLNFDFSSIFQF